jgi:F-type H+-transporting ATPase subunit b
LALALLALACRIPARADAPESSPTQPSQHSSAPARESKQADPERKTFGGELVEETREATGADEENVNLKHSAPVRWLARKIGLSVHGTHLLLFSLNFVIVAAIIFWAARKYLPAMFRNRTGAIQKALEEARTASQDANRRLADIESRLRELDLEIGRMQSGAEKEAEAEEARIAKSAEDDIRKVVLAAEQEIAMAAKQARRELTTHTAGLAVALARKQIHIDSGADQVLVRTFATGLVSQGDVSPENDGGKDGH